MPNKKTKTSLFYNLLSALFAFVLWGSWAYYINSMQSLETSNTGIIAGLTQGTASFIITFIIVHLVTRIYNFLHTSASINLLAIKLVAPAVLTVSITGTGLFIIHNIMNTPHIAKTIAPALLVAFLFSLFTAYKLNNTKSER
ncbi:MAG TPA: hypothetical protein EYH38_09355 [Leucothrix sp.]|nr:hypothetical protein [Leucothrix sp.]